MENSTLQTAEMVIPIINRYKDSSLSFKMKNKKKIEYFNLSCAFDIETSSFKINDDKVAIMYHWALGINGEIMCGRDWDSFVKVINTIAIEMNCSESRRLVIYIHNENFEFQFMRKHFDWAETFSLDERKICMALTTTGIEFRCSYILTGYKLENLAKQLVKYKCEKMVGDLDYSKIRHSKTPMTEKEMKYIENDIRVPSAYIQETMERDGNMASILITKTSYVRKMIKKECNKDKRYSPYIKSLTIESDEYKMLKRGFQGGYTHASSINCTKVFENVRSCDFTSAYPSVMLSEKFPASKGEKVVIHNMSEYYEYAKNGCLLFDITFNDLELKQNVFDTPISISKCFKHKGTIIDNGRIVMAKTISLTITDVDFNLYKNTYNWSSMSIGTCYRYAKAYLPKPIIDSILKLYVDKTKLKGVAGRETDYMIAKGNLNSAYGMIVTDVARDEIVYDGDWSTEPVSIDEAIDKYNQSWSRFLFYPWGLWVTAYTRQNLWTGILSCGKDYIYSDTDSIKLVNFENHKLYFDKFNDIIISKMENVAEHYKIDFENFNPMNIKGVHKMMGIWDTDDGEYKQFKTLGSKRYLVEHTDGEYEYTVAGVSKSHAKYYMVEKYGEENLFKEFKKGMLIPAGYSGKSTHNYIDDERIGVIKDYYGVECEYKELSAIHLEGSRFEINISPEYEKLLTLVQGKITIQ